MNPYVNPPGVAGPFGGYSHYCTVPPGSRVIQIAGQVGVAPDGTIAADAEQQCVLAFANVTAILRHAGMQVADITKLSVFMTDHSYLSAYRAARQQALGDLKPPTTLVIVSSLVNPQWKVEIEAFAATRGAT
jgi:enamine deaminase RidA (YjgF/YER057c/UK114 family)